MPVVQSFHLAYSQTDQPTLSVFIHKNKIIHCKMEKGGGYFRLLLVGGKKFKGGWWELIFHIDWRCRVIAVSRVHLIVISQTLASLRARARTTLDTSKVSQSCRCG